MWGDLEKEKKIIFAQEFNGVHKLKQDCQYFPSQSSQKKREKWDGKIPKIYHFVTVLGQEVTVLVQKNGALLEFHMKMMKFGQY